MSYYYIFVPRQKEPRIRLKVGLNFNQPVPRPDVSHGRFFHICPRLTGLLTNFHADTPRGHIGNNVCMA